ncbi:sigma-70 family RNA polymerase sigma factor [Bacillus sp. S/N-304-OC-R1]|uniref:sigma-70 family RNA polymerase sigma factor n=1 Tax=Bacillus sp. S/N-304-OC-R1 TaxID=2758034 RepID=UPI001C8EBEAC|nr:sigma-70 family RNA polymerase sigma factor [Bacillus sp. S/N-304-OC-R1]MBY0122006.1 sigma-70 family RNA polymerase sigma factor [Bacillus sp. S/N-304-OC-R1]
MNSEALVISAQQGNKEAFTKLIKNMEHSLYKVSKAILLSDSECLDAVQEAVLIAYTTIHQLREPKFFKTWITRILINECNKIRRNQTKIVKLDGMSEPSINEQRDAIIDLQTAVNSLDSDLRTVITLYYYEDLSIKDIGAILDIAGGTVKSRLNRARTKLFSLLSTNNSEGRMLHE